MNEKKFEESSRIMICSVGGVLVPFLFSSLKDELATYTDARFRIAYKEVFTGVFALVESSREEKKEEYKQFLSGLVSFQCDFYHYLPSAQYAMFTRELFRFCAHASKYLNMRDYTLEMLPKLNLLYVADKYDAMRQLDIYTERK